MPFFVKRGPRFDDVVRLKLEFRFTGVRLIARPVTLIFMKAERRDPATISVDFCFWCG